MNEMNQDHIVRFLTAFTRRQEGGDGYYLMLEWADGGNLRNLWRSHPHPILSSSLIKASIKQLHGLAKALHAAHSHNDQGASFRHGDLKPENILRYQGDSIIGTLKIGNWGKARELNKVLGTELRMIDTTTYFATRRYEAPEVGISRTYLGQSEVRLSRLYDIWSMGCITLEFLIWLLYGSEGVERFHRELSDGSPFYQLIEDNGIRLAEVQAAAVRWMDRMSREPVCSIGSALGRLLELVRTGLLVVKLPRRTESEKTIVAATTSLEGLPSPILPSIVITPTEQYLERVELPPEESGPTRISAFEYERIMEDILFGEPNNADYWATDVIKLPPSTIENKRIISLGDTEFVNAITVKPPEPRQVS